MPLFHDKVDNLKQLFLMELKDIYDAEHRLTDALPDMADAATSPQLKSAFKEHLQETQRHVERLETVFKRLGEDPDRETCQAMKGLIKEGEDAIKLEADGPLHDAALIAAAQRVEHYEIAGYGTLRSLAEHLGLSDVAQTLQQTLDEEGAADKKLTKIAEDNVNVRAGTAKV